MIPSLRTRRLLFALLGSLLFAPNGLLAESPSRAFRVDLLDGRSFTGSLQTLNGEQLVLRGAEGGTAPVSSVLRITRVSDATPIAGERAALHFVDGGWLATKGFRLKADQLQALLPDALTTADGSPVSLATAAVRGARIGPAGRHQRAWARIIKEPADTDVLVVYRDQGREVRGAPCAIEEIGEREVRVRLDGELLDVPIARVHGFVFADTRLPSDAEPGDMFVHGGFGRLSATEVTLSDDSLRIETTHGFTLVVPLPWVSEVDFTPSRVRWLGELPLMNATWRPLFGFPTGLGENRSPGILLDRSFDGGPLSVIDPDAYPRPGSVQEFERGVALKSRSEVVYKLPSGFPRFRAVAGIDPKTIRQGSVVLRLFADDQLVYEHTVDGSRTVLVDAELGDATRLRVVVDYGDNLDTGDNLHLGSARLTK